ncbi:MAG: hypothetical protein SW833_16815 [Cyanobacteriota bacterium]|nr:hypothetical protein [Cyanobacteriota bacterium]
METMDLNVALAAPDPIALTRAVAALPRFELGVPTRVSMDMRTQEATTDWLERWVPHCEDRVVVWWGKTVSTKDFITMHKYGVVNDFGIVKFKIHDFPRDPQAVIELLAPLPWTYGTFVDLYPIWSCTGSPYKYRAPGFGLDYNHGWGCCFRGDEGHRRLVSRRWLEFGPWRLLRGSHDTSLIQFHDLEADADTALNQARVGHQRIGSTATGGYIQSFFEVADETRRLSGTYLPDERKYRLTIAGREIPQEEMLDMCLVRHYQGLGPQYPVEKISYLFIDEKVARTYLHELWLREIECWSFKLKSGEHYRLDTDYHPVPEPPEWVRQVEEQESEASNSQR